MFSKLLDFSLWFASPFITWEPVWRFLIWFIWFFAFQFLLRLVRGLTFCNYDPTAYLDLSKALDQWQRDKAAKVIRPKPDVINWDRPSLMTKSLRMTGNLLWDGLGWLNVAILLLLVLAVLEVIFQGFRLGHPSTWNTAGLRWFIELVKEPVFFGPIIAGAVVGGLTGRFSSVFVKRHYIDFKLNRWLNSRDRKVTKKSDVRTGSSSDVRTLRLPERIDFNPVDFFGVAKETGGMFLGVDEQGKPTGVDRKTWVKSNVQVMGPPGTGKGVQAAVVLAQGMRNYGDAVIVFDPKNDEWAPSVLQSMTDRFTVLDLRRGQPPQFNLFENTTPAQAFELFVAGFGLAAKGTDADHYRLGDRKAAYQVAQAVADGKQNIETLLEAARSLPDAIKSEAKGFVSQLEEIALIEPLRASGGVGLDEVLRKGGCLYVIGAMRDDPVIRLQKMLFVRMVQFVEARPALEERRHVSIFLDEAKYLLSAPSVNALGTVRDKGCNILIAHQSLGDLGSVGADLDPESVKATVIDNTPLKWIYRTKSFEAAEWVSQQTGEIQVDVEQRTVTRDGSVEVTDAKTRLVKETRYLIDTNTIQHLPAGCAVCIGAGLAHLAFTNPIQVKKRPVTLVTGSPIVAQPVLAMAQGKPIAAPQEAAGSDKTSSQGNGSESLESLF